MKYFRVLILSFALLVSANALVTCSSNQATNEQGKEYTAAYICPMHCEGSGSDEMGQCPVCGMDYEPNEQRTEGEHTH